MSRQIKGDEKNVALYSRRGDVHFFRGEFREAVRDYEKMVQLDPTSDVTLKTMLEQAMEAEVELRVCQQSMALWNMTKDDLIDGVEILGATSIIDLALNSDHVMYF